jgi:hypothetical protein
LGALLTVQQREEYNRAIDTSLTRARRALDGVQGRSLSSEQQAGVLRIRAFLSQAESARNDDLPLAKNLAERAELLAQDLLGALR